VVPVDWGRESHGASGAVTEGLTASPLVAVAVKVRGLPVD
jgi:hypothetical protein